MNKRYLISYAILLIALISMPLQAKGEDPKDFVDDLTTKVIKTLSQNQAKIKNNPKKLYEIIENLIVPNVDFYEMSRWVAGRTAWKKSSKSAQKQFMDEFKSLVINAYAHALNGVHDEKIEFLPIRADIENKKRVSVTSLVYDKQRGKIRMVYRLIRHKNSWKFYDVVIEGVSILKGYQAQFSEDIRQNGLLAVAKKIQRHNNEEK